MNLRILSLSTLALTLAACAGDDSVGATVSATANETSTGDSTGDTSSTTGDSESGDSESGDSGEVTGDSGLCGGACGADATCNPEGNCVCNPGFDGDGASCVDIDECATGKHTCDPDATCTNTPGDYTCECNDGYKGSGISCKDIDECNEGVDECSANATCTNTDGSYKCACNDGFTGDGFTCNGSTPFGEVCSDAEECASGLCLVDTQCTADCTIDTANDCRDQGHYGLCIFIGDQNHPFVCAGDIKTGGDKDDAIVGPGDSITRLFQSTTDIDIFLLKVPQGKYDVYATPDPDDDLAIVFYNIDGTLLATQNEWGAGGIEGAVVTAGGDPLYAVVMNVGNSNGTYKFNVDPV